MEVNHDYNNSNNHYNYDQMWVNWLLNLNLYIKKIQLVNTSETSYLTNEKKETKSVNCAQENFFNL